MRETQGRPRQCRKEGQGRALGWEAEGWCPARQPGWQGAWDKSVSFPGI